MVNTNLTYTIRTSVMKKLNGFHVDILHVDKYYKDLREVLTKVFAKAHLEPS